MQCRTVLDLLATQVSLIRHLRGWRGMRSNGNSGVVRWRGTNEFVAYHLAGHCCCSVVWVVVTTVIALDTMVVVDLASSVSLCWW